jgi:hypothetical protein
VADIHRLVPNTKVAVEAAQAEVHKLLSLHFSVADAEDWVQTNLGLNVPQLLQAAAARIIASLPIGKTAAGSAINLAIELALQLIRG